MHSVPNQVSPVNLTTGKESPHQNQVLLRGLIQIRRTGKQGGLYLNNNRVDSESKRIEAADIVDGKGGTRGVCGIEEKEEEARLS